MRAIIRKSLSPQAKTALIKVTDRKPPRSVGPNADVNSCNSGVFLRSNSQAPRNASPNQWDGLERRTQHLAVVKERRICYLVTTPDFIDRAEKARKTVMIHATDLKELPFPEAAESWLEQKKMYNRESTLNCYRDYLKRLVTYFTMPLKEIHIGHIMEYQARMKKHYHPDSVNHDINMLSQIMRKAGLWQPISEHYRQLPKPEVDPPKVMSEKEEDDFFEFASKSKWALAYMVASLTNNSTASGKELRMLQLEAIDMNAQPYPTFRVPKNMKNPNRPRTIPLNERGEIIMGRLIKRASGFGSTRPEHFLFPFRIKRNFFDPNQPASESWIKAQWKPLIDAAMLHTNPSCEHIGKLPEGEKCPECRHGVISFRLKPHNLRHQIITKMLDNGTPIEMVREIAGHGVDSLATRIYYHGRLEKMAHALSRIDPERKRPISTNGNARGAKNAG